MHCRTSQAFVDSSIHPEAYFSAPGPCRCREIGSISSTEAAVVDHGRWSACVDVRPTGLVGQPVHYSWCVGNSGESSMGVREVTCEAYVVASQVETRRPTKKWKALARRYQMELGEPCKLMNRPFENGCIDSDSPRAVVGYTLGAACWSCTMKAEK
jgi:hypothetical protein